MDVGEFAGWAWAIVGVVCGVALTALVIVSVVVSVVKQVRGLK